MRKFFYGKGILALVMLCAIEFHGVAGSDAGDWLIVNESGHHLEFQKIKFEIILDAHKKILKENHVQNARFQKVDFKDFSDISIEKVTEGIKKVLYASAANIKKWQIFEKISEIIDQKMRESEDMHSRFSGFFQDLSAFRNTVIEQFKDAVQKRELFLLGALTMATELSMWITFYHTHRSSLDAEYPAVSLQVRDLLKQEVLVSGCENLYTFRDSIPESLDKDLQKCNDLVAAIKKSIEPFKTKGRNSALLWNGHKIKFLEKKQAKFDNIENLNLYFNPQDGGFFLKALEKVLRYYITENSKALKKFFSTIKDKKSFAEAVANHMLKESEALANAEQVGVTAGLLIEASQTAVRCFLAAAEEEEAITSLLVETTKATVSHFFSAVKAGNEVLAAIDRAKALRAEASEKAQRMRKAATTLLEEAAEKAAIVDFTLEILSQSFFARSTTAELNLCTVGVVEENAVEQAEAIEKATDLLVEAEKILTIAEAQGASLVAEVRATKFDVVHAQGIRVKAEAAVNKIRNAFELRLDGAEALAKSLLVTAKANVDKPSVRAKAEKKAAMLFSLSGVYQWR